MSSLRRRTIRHGLCVCTATTALRAEVARLERARNEALVERAMALNSQLHFQSLVERLQGERDEALSKKTMDDDTLSTEVERLIKELEEARAALTAVVHAANDGRAKNTIEAMDAALFVIERDAFRALAAPRIRALTTPKVKP